MAEQLWSDERIDIEALDALSYNGVMTFFRAKQLMGQVRDDYEAKHAAIADLLNSADSQLATNQDLLGKARAHIGEIEFEYAGLVSLAKQRLGHIAKLEQQVSSLQTALDAANQRIAELEAQLEWEPVNDLTLEDGRTVIVDSIALTIAEGDTAMDTLVWPEDGYEYNLCRRKEAGDETLQSASI